MSYRLYSFFCKTSDTFPSVGGAIGAASQAKHIIFLPTWGAISSTIIISIIGAIVGITTKLLVDAIIIKIKKSHKCK
jgi:hypothetical protein